MRKKRLVNKKKSIVWMMIITLLFTIQSMPQRVKAAEQTVGNMVIMVTFEKDDNGNNLTDEFADGYLSDEFSDGYPQTGKYYCWNQKSGRDRKQESAILKTSIQRKPEVCPIISIRYRMEKCR